MSFSRNLHSIDVLARLLLGFGFTYLGFVETGIIINDIVRIIIGIFGLVNIFAGFTRHCPVYNVAGIDTFRSINKQSP